MRAAAHRNQPTFRKIWWVLAVLLLSAGAWATPQVTAIGPDLYAYISDNDGSANSTFLVGSKGILVVDTGVDATEGSKLLREIRKVSQLPVLYLINTHYHPDHQGGNSVVGPNATIIYPLHAGANASIDAVLSTTPPPSGRCHV